MDSQSDHWPARRRTGFQNSGCMRMLIIIKGDVAKICTCCCSLDTFLNCMGCNLSGKEASCSETSQRRWRQRFNNLSTLCLLYDKALLPGPELHLNWRTKSGRWMAAVDLKLQLWLHSFRGITVSSSSAPSSSIVGSSRRHDKSR